MSRAPDRSHVPWPAGISSDGVTLKHDPRATIVPRRVAARERLGTHDDRAHRLVLGDVIGQGGMAVVRSATQASLGRTVAVKSLPPGKAHSPDAVVELLEEAWITGALEHPNVVPIHDVDIDEDGNPLVVLKRIDGVPWRDLMSDAARVRARFGGADLLEWNLGVLMHVLNAVRYAHSRGILHRDLKPDNVMIGEYGEVYLVDWGIAVSLRDDGTGRLPLAVHATEEFAGTPCYMAPEMLPGMGMPLSERTDIYLAGAILYEILTGVPPHRAESLEALATSVITSQPVLPPGIPSRLGVICRRAMDPDPDGRFENADQVRLAIEGYLRHRGATRILQEAEARLAELQVAIAHAHADDIQNRQRIYKLYGECRFGFHEADVAHTESVAARHGLNRAARLMIEYEFGSGDPRAAATLIADMPDPDGVLEQRVARALLEDQARRRHAARLERLGRAFDMNVGVSTRRALILVLGGVWVAVPLFNQWLASRGIERSHFGIALGTGILLLLAGCLALIAWPLFRQSVVNRRYLATLVTVYVVHGLLQGGMALAGIPVVLFPVLSLLTTSVVLSMVVVALDERLWPAALAYGAAFLAAAAWHEARFYAHAVASLVLVVSAFIVWAPRPADDA